ncbi:hypothetical protein ACE6H2_010037 [Prunus campanulata]
MDSRLLEAIKRNDTPTFIILVEKYEGIFDQREADTCNTPLHLVTKLRHLDMVSAIVTSRPDMVATENKDRETPVHEACRVGDAKILKLLLDANPRAATKLNNEKKSAFFLACSHGHVDAVNLLLDYPGMFELEEDGLDQTCIHVAAAGGHEDVVRELLRVRPDLASVIDENGNSPLHRATSKGHKQIIRMLLKHDPKLAQQKNKKGYTPLHLAAINYRTPIFEEFVLMAPNSFHCFTNDGETVFHLFVRHGHHDAIVSLIHCCEDMDILRHMNLLDRRDLNGNTILHLAVSEAQHQIAEYLIKTLRVGINSKNREGLTALDILKRDKESVEKRSLEATFMEAGSKRNSELVSHAVSHPEKMPKVEIVNNQSDTILKSTSNRVQVVTDLELQDCSINEIGSSSSMTSSSLSSSRSRNSSIFQSTPSSKSQHQHQLEEGVDNERQKPESLLTTIERQHKYPSKRHQSELSEISSNSEKKHHKVYTEALQNARNTITLVAILIATVTYAADISPPGGVNQDGPMRGQAVAGRTIAFKVFVISNYIALFTSLSIVVVLVSIIPYRRKPLMMVLSVAHKILWLSVAFMATAYVAATWVIMPHSQKKELVLVALLAISIGTLGTVFIGLCVMLIDHWLRKLKWRKERRERREPSADLEMGSPNSFVESTKHQGLHAY